MALPGVNRYAEMIKGIVGGPYYASKGTVIPYRSGETELRLTTQHPNTLYGLYVNRVYSGSFTSDSQGNVVFKRILLRGDNELILVNSVTGLKLTSWVTVREYALWLAAYAQVLEGIDNDWLEVKDALSLRTVGTRHIEDVFGETVQVFNNLGQDTDSYRYLLHEFRDAYRNFGGRFRGVETAIAAFTQVPPFGYSRRYWGPNWVLDQSMLGNHRLTQRAATVTYYSTVISGVQLEAVEADVISGVTPSYELIYDSSAKTLQWGWGGGGEKGPAIPAADGSLFLPGPHPVISYILGLNTTVSLSDGEEFLYLNFGSGTVVVDLTALGATPSIADLVSAINTAVGFTVASSYNSKLLLSGEFDFIRIEHGFKNAAVKVFGVRQGDIQLPQSAVIPGVELLAVRGSVNIYDSATLQYDATLKKLRWWSSGYTLSGLNGYVDVSSSGTFTLTDSGGNQLDVYVQSENLPIISAINPFSMAYCRSYSRPLETQGLWVWVSSGSLPASSLTVSVKISDSVSLAVNGNAVVPDMWRLEDWTAGGSTVTLEPSVVITDRDSGLSPCTAFRYVVQDTSLGTLSYIGKTLLNPLPGSERGSNYPQKVPGLFYDYEGFEAVWSAWFLSHSADPVSVTLGFSFDGGTTWPVEGTPTAVATDAGAQGYEHPTYVSLTCVIPAGLEPGEVLVRAKCVRTGSLPIKVSMDAPRVDVRHITSRALSDTTVVRSRHRQYMGELIFVWSPEPLTLVEKQYLGLLHKTTNKDHPFAGVLIKFISSDTPNGNGLLEYSYTAAGDIRKLRWTAYGDAWAIGLGWVQVLVDGVSRLYSSGGSYLDIQVTYDLLAKASSTVSVGISDQTIIQGNVRDVAAAQSSLDLVDVTEYSSSGVPINLRGCITEADFSSNAVDLVNLDMTSENRYAFLSPTVVRQEAEVLTFASSPPHIATLDYESNQLQSDSVFLVDGVPLPDNLWTYVDSTHVRILNPSDYDANAEYTLSYNPIYQFTSPLLLLPTTFQEYAWFADYMMWDRLERQPVTRVVTVPLVFNANTGLAPLPKPSSREKGRSTLYYETESGIRDIPPSFWTFVGDSTVQVDPRYFISRATYFISHPEIHMSHQRVSLVTFEHRSGANETACLGASWREIERNENVDVSVAGGSHAMHQLRLSVIRIQDLKDFRIHSVVLKGLHIIGSNASVGGLTNV